MEKTILDKLHSALGATVENKETGEHFTAFKRKAEIAAVVGADVDGDGDVELPNSTNNSQDAGVSIGADEVALVQVTFSQDDSGKFIPDYVFSKVSDEKLVADFTY